MENKQTFEEARERLAQITERMESGDLTLAEMTSLYKEGMHLYQDCQKMLDLTEKELVTLTEGEGQ